MQRVQPEAVTALETLEAFRTYLVRRKRRTTDAVQLNEVFKYLAAFEYEIKKADRAEDPRQLRLFD
jgi:hypothetical protein